MPEPSVLSEFIPRLRSDELRPGNQVFGETAGFAQDLINDLMVLQTEEDASLGTKQEWEEYKQLVDAKLKHLSDTDEAGLSSRNKDPRELWKQIQPTLESRIRT